jgi:hypothetical protein
MPFGKGLKGVLENEARPSRARLGRAKLRAVNARSEWTGRIRLSSRHFPRRQRRPRHRHHRRRRHGWCRSSPPRVPKFVEEGLDVTAVNAAVAIEVRRAAADRRDDVNLIGGERAAGVVDEAAVRALPCFVEEAKAKLGRQCTTHIKAECFKCFAVVVAEVDPVARVFSIGLLPLVGNGAMSRRRRRW